MGREVSDAIEHYTLEQMRIWLKAVPGRKPAHLAKAIGVSKAQVSDSMKRHRGIGLKSAHGMAELLKLDWTEYKARAESANRSRPVPAKDLRTNVLALFEGSSDRSHQIAVARVSTAKHKGALDSVEFWMRRVIREIDIAREELTEPAKTKSESDRLVAEHLANEAANLAGLRLLAGAEDRTENARTKPKTPPPTSKSKRSKSPKND